jgi:hypothetical protein
MNKAFLFALLALVMALPATAQLKSEKMRKISIENFRASTTVFFYRKADEKRLKQYKTAISAVWKVTPIIFVPYEEAAKYQGKDEYSWIRYGGYTTTVTNVQTQFSSSYSHQYLLLASNYDNLCRMDLFTKNNNDPNMFPDEVDFYNFSPVQVAAFLSSINTNMVNNYIRVVYDETKNKAAIREIANDTLFIPENILIHSNKFTGTQSRETDDVFKKFPYPHRVCSNDELFNIFFVQKRGRYLFDYTKSSTDKYVTIFDVKGGKIIYRNYKAVSYNLKEKDINAID